MSEFFGTPAPLPRVSQLWPQVVQRLASAEMAQFTGGAGRVYMSTQKYENLAGEYWARAVVVPVARPLAPSGAGPGGEILVSFLVRADVRPPEDPAYDPLLVADAIQSEALRLLVGWVPADTPGCAFKLPVYRATAPQPAPLWDEADGVWYTSSEYRVLAYPVNV